MYFKYEPAKVTLALPDGGHEQNPRVVLGFCSCPPSSRVESHWQAHS